MDLQHRLQAMLCCCGCADPRILLGDLDRLVPSLISQSRDESNAIKAQQRVLGVLDFDFLHRAHPVQPLSTQSFLRPG